VVGEFGGQNNEMGRRDTVECKREKNVEKHSTEKPKKIKSNEKGKKEKIPDWGEQGIVTARKGSWRKKVNQHEA